MSIVGAALRGFGKALGKKTGKSTSKFVKRRLTVNGTPLNIKEKAIVGASGALATAGAAATGYGYKKAYNKLKEIKEKKSK
jgi:hypothetical protein